LRESSGLRKLELPRSAVRIIKGPLPPTLEAADLSYCQFLRELPDFARSRLTFLSLSGLQLRRVPPLPQGLRYLNLSHNWSAFPGERLRITSHVMAASDCEIDVHFTGVTRADLPPPPPGRQPPRFLFLAEELGPTTRPPRNIETVVARWFGTADPALAATQARWARIAQRAGESREFAEFRVFLDRLAGTENAKDPLHGSAFRAEVREWLVECASPQRASLRETTFAACLEANETCQDRTSWTFTQLKSLRLNDDITFGLYDDRVPEVIAAAREAYVKDALEKLASRRADAIDAARKLAAETQRGVGAHFEPCNRLDIYLAYIVKLGARAGLTTTGSRAMRFFGAAGVTEAEIAADWPELTRRLSSATFETFFSRDFFPWKSLLRRNFSDAYSRAEAEMQNTMEARIAARIDLEIANLGLDRADPAAAVLIDDLTKDLGPSLRREIEDATYQGITRRFLQIHHLEHLLMPQAGEAF